jgi:transposase, IS30 family
MGSHYCHLKLNERRKLAKWLEAKMAISEIADRLGLDPSTIYRDIKRNRYTDKELPELDEYHALVAQDKNEARRAIHRKLIRQPEVKAAVENRSKAGWSPEQVAGRMRLERYPIRVSCETIYRFAYSKDGCDEQFYRQLPEHRRPKTSSATWLPQAQPDPYLRHTRLG